MAVSAESLLPCNVSAHDLLPEGGLLTFIVPASGRSTLHRTLISLQQQENPEWRALVLLDGAHVGLEQRAYRLVSLEKARMRVCCLLKRFGSSGFLLGFTRVRRPGAQRCVCARAHTVGRLCG